MSEPGARGSLLRRQEALSEASPWSEETEGDQELEAGITFSGDAGSRQPQEKQSQQGHPQKQLRSVHGGAGVGLDRPLLGQAELC